MSQTAVRFAKISKSVIKYKQNFRPLHVTPEHKIVWSAIKNTNWMECVTAGWRPKSYARSTWEWVFNTRKSSLPLELSTAVLSQTNSHHPFKESLVPAEHEREQMSLQTIHSVLRNTSTVLCVSVYLPPSSHWMYCTECRESVCQSQTEI